MHRLHRGWAAREENNEAATVSQTNRVINIPEKGIQESFDHL